MSVVEPSPPGRPIDGAWPEPDQTLTRPTGSTDDQSAWLAQIDIADLRRLLASSPLIEQAKGVLMGYFSIAAVEAFALLRRWSSNHNVKIRVLCADIVQAVAVEHPERYGGLTAYLRSRSMIGGGEPAFDDR